MSRYEWEYDDDDICYSYDTITKVKYDSERIPNLLNKQNYELDYYLA